MRMFIIAYWVIMTIFAGAVDGYHISRCPNDKPTELWKVSLGILAFPGVIGWVLTAPSDYKSKCENSYK